MTCPPGHVAYHSPALAANALILHQLAHPWCGGMHEWRCADHWHIGHDSAPIGASCKDAYAEDWAIRQAARS